MPRSSSAERLAAGRAALQRGAWGEARDTFRAAAAGNPEAEAFEGLGWSLYWLGEIEASLDEREKAYRAWLARGAREDAARVAIGIAVGSYDVRGEAVTTGWLERARDLLRRVPLSATHGWLAFYEGHAARLMSGDATAARRLARKAGAIAVRCGEPQLELLARALEGLALVTAGRVTDGMRKVDEATTAAMAGEMRDLDSVAQTCCMLLYACERTRDYKRAAAWQQRIAHFAEQWQVESLFAVCTTQHAAMLAGAGRWSEAEQELERALERLAETRPLLVPDALVHLAELRRRQGRYDEALAIVKRVETRSEAMLTRAAIALDSGDAGTALALGERLLERSPSEKWIERAIAHEIVVRASLHNGDANRAAEACTALKALADRVRTPMSRAIEQMAAGSLAAHSGALDASRAAFTEAFELFTTAEAPFEAATARVKLAHTLLLLQRGAAAAEEVDRAIEIFEALGATREKEKGAALRHSATGLRITIEQPLSSRERQVLHLIADGLADKELAIRLSLSEHTIHRHVSNILRKLDVASRSAAVARAARSGWL